MRLHWTDQPYLWNINDGPEVFVVLDGAIDMHHRHDGEQHIQRLTPGDICYAEPANAHVYLIDTFGLTPGPLELGRDGHAVHGELFAADQSIWLHLAGNGTGPRGSLAG